MNRVKIILILLVPAIFGCKHDNIDDLLGPDINELGIVCPPDDFSISTFTTGTNAVNLSIATIDINASMTSTVNWELGLIADNGAQLKTTGFSNSVAYTWNGTTTNGILTKTGDSCKSYLLVECKDTVWGPTFYISLAKNYSGTSVDDFDGNTTITNWSNASSQLTGLNITASDSGAAQGDFYLYLEGVDIGSGSYLGQAMAQPSTINYGLTNSANNVWLNAIIRGSSNAIVEFRIYENDGDYWFYQVPVTWSGWQVVNMKYEDFSVGTGGTDQDPTDVKQIRITMRSNDPTPSAIANVDFVHFTEGSPFTP